MRSKCTLTCPDRSPNTVLVFVFFVGFGFESWRNATNLESFLNLIAIFIHAGRCGKIRCGRVCLSQARVGPNFGYTSLVDTAKIRMPNWLDPANGYVMESCDGRWRRRTDIFMSCISDMSRVWRPLVFLFLCQRVRLVVEKCCCVWEWKKPNESSGSSVVRG